MQAKGGPGNAVSDASPTTERRGPPRKDVLIPAIVVCDDGQENRCVLRDVSSTGAKIAVPRAHRLPDRFRIVTGHSPLGFQVTRAWQRGDFVGVRLDLPKEAP